MPPNTPQNIRIFLSANEILAEQLKSGSVFKPLTHQQPDGTVVVSSETPFEGYWDWEDSASSGETTAKQDGTKAKRKYVRTQIEESIKRMFQEKEMKRRFSADEIENKLIEDATRRSKATKEHFASDPNAGYWDMKLEEIHENHICASKQAITLDVDPALLIAAKNFPQNPKSLPQKPDDAHSYWDWDAGVESGMTIAKKTANERKKREAIRRVEEKCKKLAELRLAQSTFSVKVIGCNLRSPSGSDKGYWFM